MGKVVVFGGSGLVGSALCRRLNQEMDIDNCFAPTSRDVNLVVYSEVLEYLAEVMPETVYLAAGKVGGIKANSESNYQFLDINVSIGLNVLRATIELGIPKLLNFGSSCIYPVTGDGDSSIDENLLLNGILEPTNIGYAIAKITVLMACCEASRSKLVDARTIMPCNTYGPNDNFDPFKSHVIPGLIARMDLSRDQTFEIWGTPKTSREFIYVDDLADLSVTLAAFDQKEFNEATDGKFFINVGTGKQFHIEIVAEKIRSLLRKKCQFSFGGIGLVGPKNKCLNNSRLERAIPGYRYTSLDEGLKRTINWYRENQDNLA